MTVFTRSKVAAAAVAAVLLAGTFSCGKKAPPFLPVPLAARDLTVREIYARGGEVRFTFRVPTEVFSFAGEEERWQRAALLRRGAGEGDFTAVAETEMEGGFEFGSRAALADATAAAGSAYQYRLELRKAESQEWAAAGPFEVTLADLPALAGPPRVASRQGALAVTWQPPAAAPAGAGWALVRREEGGGAAEAVSPAPLSAPSYVDTRVLSGVTYCYAVAPVVAEGLVVMEGVLSAEACGRTVDRTPPPPPTELLAVAGADGIRLSWLPSGAGDVAGYRVYRSADNAVFLPLAGELVTGSPFLDKEARPGVSYRYRVTAVDGSSEANESPFSNTARALLSAD